MNIVKKKHPKVSIGMPVFNGQPYITNAINSLLAQTYKNFELIISDNASTDSTEEICRAYAENDTRISYTRKKNNVGAFSNFQTVLASSTGEYFMWAAADDVWDPTWLEVLITNCVKYQCITFGRVRQIDSDGKVIDYSTNNRDLSFTGSRLRRRTLFFLMPGLIGKANLFYGIYPKEILAAEFLSSRSNNFRHSDMLFIYTLLKEIELRAGYNTYLYKRIHFMSEGSDLAKESSARPSSLNKLLYANFEKIEIFLRYYDGYFILSNWVERVSLICFFPFAIGYDLFIRLTWCKFLNRRLRKKIFK
jgi:glycosyltransferase involved in cell wall biosynthesis